MEMQGLTIAGGPIRSGLSFDPKAYYSMQYPEYIQQLYVDGRISVEQLEEYLEYSLNNANLN